MRHPIRHIYRERRRLSVVMLLSAIAGFVLAATTGAHTSGFATPLTAGLGFAAIMGAAALFTALIMPVYRSAWEAAALALLIYALLIARIPSLAIESTDLALLRMLGFFVATLAIHHLIYGHWSDKLLRLRGHTERAIAVTGLERAALWPVLFPDPDTANRFYEQSLEQIQPVPGDAQALRLVNCWPGGLHKERLLKFEEIRDGWSFRYSYRVTGVGDVDPDLPRSHTLVLEPREGRTTVHARWHEPGVPLRRAFGRWIDDWAGRELDQMIGQAERQARAQPDAQDTATA